MEEHRSTMNTRSTRNKSKGRESLSGGVRKKNRVTGLNSFTLKDREIWVVGYARSNLSFTRAKE
jgi:hypothetical protein